MNIDQWIKLLGVIVPLIQTLIWPALILFALLYLGKTVKNYVENLGRDKNVSEIIARLGSTGVEFSIKRQVQVATNLALAVKQGSKEISDEEVDSSKHAIQGLPGEKTEEIIQVASNAAAPQVVQQIAGARVLWVDDNPSNNTYIRAALEALGIQFVISTSTEDAMKEIHTNRKGFNVVISDLGRKTSEAYDRYAGFRLLEEIRKANINIPVIIYTGASRPEYQAKTKNLGGFGMTNKAQELFRLVIEAIQSERSSSS